MIVDPRLDHVAFAVQRWQDGWPRFATDLGGRWVSGGQDPTYSPMQVRFSNNMKVELLMTTATTDENFLRRFLNQHGPAPHHFTFKVPDIHAAIDACRAAGYEPINIDVRYPEWKEAFVHPKAATGVLVQFAQAQSEWGQPPPEDFPPQTSDPAALLHVAHAVGSLSDGLALFRDLLSGTEEESGSDEAARWIELSWPGGGRIRLLEPTSPSSPVSTWIGDRSGRVHHLTFECADPASVPDALPLTDGAYEVPADKAHGVPLLLQPRP